MEKLAPKTYAKQQEAQKQTSAKVITNGQEIYNSDEDTSIAQKQDNQNTQTSELENLAPKTKARQQKNKKITEDLYNLDNAETEPEKLREKEALKTF